MNYLFVNGRFPQYSQTFVHDQIKSIKAYDASSVSVYARSRTSFRFEKSVPECAEELLYGKPFGIKLARRIAAGFFRHPMRSIRFFALFATKKITYSTMMLGLQLTTAPDITITHFGNNYENGVELKKYFFPTMKNVVVFHGHDVSSYIAKNGWNNYNNASKFIDSAICVNKSWADAIRENTKIRDVRTIYLGTTHEDRHRRLHGDDGVFSIVFVGRFVEKKGFDLLYEAVKKLRLSMKRPFRVHCIGDGPGFSRSKKTSAGEGLNETFIFYGSKQKSFVRQLMRECDLLVAPSRVASDGDSEGLPVVLMEAMMAGIPVISTYHSGIPELIHHMETGILVAENDLTALENAIEFAVTNPDRMRELSDHAYDHVSEAHNEIIQAQKFTAVLKEIA